MCVASSSPMTPPAPVLAPFLGVAGEETGGAECEGDGDDEGEDAATVIVP